jgi:hypothetical protein
MGEVVWKLPGLRRMSSFQRGFSLAGGLIFFVSLALALFDGSITAKLPHAILSDIGQIGATLLVAYAVETSWLIKRSRSRGSEKENFVGFAAGLGSCGALGIAFAVALLGHPKGLPFTDLEHFAAAWAMFSVTLLAGLVAMLPFVLYEWAHSINTEYPDE